MGVKLSSTANSPKDGEIIKVMIGPMVCDLPAICKVIGMAGHSSDKNQCSFCCVTKDEINAVDLDHICPRNTHGLRKQAIEWKNAVTLADRKAIFQTYGVRYSVLYELPYFDPLSNAAVEPMHNIFLGLLQHHGQNIFGLKISAQNSEYQTKRRCSQPRGRKTDVLGDENEDESADQESLYAPDCQIPTDLNPLGARFSGKAENLQRLQDVNQEI
ncbi:hypothetical protein MJO28_013950 [Puccinia striiformis f. sp. tritici]|uniref:Uncharacterized protein n=2 Tax=Puccinia striiformis TaxID=27350 RepID=A0A2S4VI47_9BASI|nr:hypothetical protein MJO28_013950 [Puccinia striiformis f. sp. tritici]POW09213.1 hypothetical protein PSTT_06953 [Puccinia striiformis]